MARVYTYFPFIFMFRLMDLQIFWNVFGLIDFLHNFSLYRINSLSYVSAYMIFFELLNLVQFVSRLFFHLNLLLWAFPRPC